MFSIKSRFKAHVCKNGFTIVQVFNASIAAAMWLYFVSHGFSENSILDAVYEIQARSLDQGHLFIVPGPLESFYHDSLMFRGRYYFYWGLFPSVCLLLLSKLFGWTASHYLMAGSFFFSLIYFFQKILLELTEHAASSRTALNICQNLTILLLTWLLIFVLPFPIQNGWFFSRFVVYEQHVIFGISLAMPGLYFLIKAIKKKNILVLGISTLFFSLAAWTRQTWIPFTLILFAATPFMYRRWHHRNKSPFFIRKAAGLLLFSTVLFAGLFYLNYIRFGSFFDFGMQHQNPSFYLYLRNLRLFFSPLTRLWNTVFNIAAYYLPWSLIEHSGLAERAFSFVEGYAPSFFFFNPQFVVMCFIIPFGVYKAIKNNEPNRIPLFVLLAATLNINMIFGIYGLMVIQRYFIEFYWFLILSFFSSLLMLLRPNFAALLLFLMLCFYIPDTINAFSKIRPELRKAPPVISSIEANADGAVAPPPKTVKWPEGALSAQNIIQSPYFSLIGVDSKDNTILLAKDISAVYIRPVVNPLNSNPILTISGIAPLYEKGAAMIYFENRFMASIDLLPDKRVDVSVNVPFKISKHAPYQVLVVFLAGNDDYLPPRSTDKYVLSFKEIRLETK